MQQRVAFLFTRPPHGDARGREGVDALLSAAAAHPDPKTAIAVFFLHEGVLHLLPQQQPDAVLARDYIATLQLLALYEIETLYVCQDSLLACGLSLQQRLVVEAERLSALQIAEQLACASFIFTF